MKYINQEQYQHGQSNRVGVLITNLGTPEAPERGALKAYLKQFLSDPRVVEVPRLLWWFILHGIILNIRPTKSAAAYAKVWTEEGSPLLLHTKAQAQALSGVFMRNHGEDVCIEFAMRYGQPSIDDAIGSLLDKGVKKLLVLPLYPQYSGPTTASTFDAVAKDFQGRRSLPELRFITHYHDHPSYIEALASKIRRHWEQQGQAEKILFSYHGEPQSYLDRGDPYHCECHKTTRLVAAALGLEEHQFDTTFQSRFGREPWLQPYTDEVLKSLPGQGIKSVQVICPGFSSDCLETIEEIDMENRGYFLDAGGVRFEYIECLNSDPEHIEALAQLVTEHTQGWFNQDSDDADSKALAFAKGAKR